MRLSDYLEKGKIKRVRAAQALGLSPARVTFLCSDEGWPATRDLAERIRDFSQGKVMPNDFLKPPIPEKPEAKPNE
jgi:3,4-dihydroxy 2-butanone 4-phosphate synthase/GTP cyclohydrolase II